METRRLRFRVRAAIGVAAVACVLIALFAPSLRDPPPLVTKAAHLHGKPLAAITRDLGRPDSDDTFAMPSIGPSELRIELLNAYPQTPANANVLIKELTWRQGDHVLVVWLHKPQGVWVVLDTCRYHKKVQF